MLTHVVAGRHETPSSTEARTWSTGKAEARQIPLESQELHAAHGLCRPKSNPCALHTHGGALTCCPRAAPAARSMTEITRCHAEMLEKELRIKAKEARLEQAEKKLAARDAELAEKDRENAAKDSEISAKKEELRQAAEQVGGWVGGWGVGSCARHVLVAHVAWRMPVAARRRSFCAHWLTHERVRV